MSDLAMIQALSEIAKAVGEVNINFDAQTILDSLKTVDGAGSGLDADMVDGLHADDVVQPGDNLAIGESGFPIRETHFGVGSNHKALQIGSDDDYHRGLALNIEPAGITDTITGHGTIAIPNRTVVAPDYINNKWRGVLRHTGDQLFIGGGMSSGELVGNGIVVNNDGSTNIGSGVSIGTNGSIKSGGETRNVYRVETGYNSPHTYLKITAQKDEVTGVSGRQYLVTVIGRKDDNAVFSDVWLLNVYGKYSTNFGVIATQLQGVCTLSVVNNTHTDLELHLVFPSGFDDTWVVTVSELAANALSFALTFEIV